MSVGVLVTNTLLLNVVTVSIWIWYLVAKLFFCHFIVSVEVKSNLLWKVEFSLGILNPLADLIKEGSLSSVAFVMVTSYEYGISFVTVFVKVAAEAANVAIKARAWVGEVRYTFTLVIPAKFEL